MHNREMGKYYKKLTLLKVRVCFVLTSFISEILVEHFKSFLAILGNCKFIKRTVELGLFKEIDAH